ncbi:menaquinone biosynthetic enzyme MqnA/MqnD family protein [Heliophilum fasciatum]|uniref:Chorismate dehydratase n=1 Tax=Heliophilum fasciatum TaxID=35700 RepID=A0A4R2RLS4_9FIRM|nr:menaquinone biosynthesis protein [Heliophilum fasciatum]MCW2278459.1 chorismate dehydratase [Heliophilum fasciatum]TCP63589.1 futalosine synthase [Heliophilum fasciatum]
MLRLGRVDYVNVFPIYHAFETGAVPLVAETVRGVPAVLNQKFMAGELDITPISAFAYASQPETGWVLPDVSISANGRVASISLFSRKPIEELDGEMIAVTTSSATSVALLQILLQKHYGLRCSLLPMAPNLTAMLQAAPAALLIGDDALREGEHWGFGAIKRQARQQGVPGDGQATQVGDEEQPLWIVDLGEVWKAMTGLPMVFALWAIRRDFSHRETTAIDQVAEAFRQARLWSTAHQKEVIAAAKNQYDFSLPVLEDYFTTIRYDLDGVYRQAAERFFQLSAEIGLLPAPVPLKVWGEGRA